MKLFMWTSLAIAAVAMTSCGGGKTGSSASSDALLFGAVPGIYLNYEQETNALLEEAQASDNPKDLQAIDEKGEALKENLQGELEKAAQTWSGTTLEVTTGEELKVNTPLTVTFDGFSSSTSPKFTLAGDVETTQEINANYNKDLLKYYSTRQNELLTFGVLLIGLDEQGQEITSQRIGSLQLAWANDQVVISAGTKVVFDDKLTFMEEKAEAYTKIKSLKIKADNK